MNIVEIDIRQLTPNTGQIADLPSNPRKWDRADVEKIARSLQETPELFQMRPCLVYEQEGKYVILGGNLRYEGAKKNRLKSVPCIVIPQDTPADKLKEIVIKDNGAFGAWDTSMLEMEWSNLPLDDWGVPEWGDEEIPEEKELPTAEEDDFEEGKDDVEKRCVRGDVWKLGEHRLMCGSSIDENDVKGLMDSDYAELLFTSPPYSDMRDYRGGKDLSVDNISMFIPTYEPFVKYQAVNLGIQRKDAEIIQYWDDYINKAHLVGLKLMAWNVWDKLMCGSIGQQNAFVPIRHEWIFVFGKEYKDINLTWGKKEESIYEGKSERVVRQKDGSTKKSTKGDASQSYKKMESVVSMYAELGAIRHKHPATFPVQLPSEYILSMTNEGDIVAEPFGGSGTTLIACEQLNRKCRIMELDEHYCDVILARWEKLTGKKAERI